jgi:hypothetical protein
MIWAKMTRPSSAFENYGRGSKVYVVATAATDTRRKLFEIPIDGNCHTC